MCPRQLGHIAGQQIVQERQDTFARQSDARRGQAKICGENEMAMCLACASMHPIYESLAATMQGKHGM